jgi:hypothetical protein
VCSQSKRTKKAEPTSSSKGRPSVHTHNASAVFAAAGGEVRRTEKGCRCGRTKCLKQYCACFRIDARCTPDCHCTDCRNDGRHEEERMMAVRLIRLNDPQAFKGTDLQLDDVVVKTPRGTEKTVRGCRCRRSKCQKKYCECFGAGLRCSDNCICEDCENGNEPGAQHKPRPAAAPAKGKGKAVPSSSARPPVPPKGSKLSAAQSAKVGLLVASARPGIPQGQATQKARKRNLSVHVPNPNQHAPAGKTLPAGRMAGAPGSAGLDPPLDSAQLRSAQLGSAQLGSARLASDAPLDSARSFGSAGGGTPSSQLDSPRAPLQWGDTTGAWSARGPLPSPITRNMSGLGPHSPNMRNMGHQSPITRNMSNVAGAPSPLFRGMSGLDRGFSGLDRGMSGLGGHSIATRHSPKSPMLHRNISGFSALNGNPPDSPGVEGGGDMPGGPADAGGANNHDLPPAPIADSGRMTSADFNGMFV